MRRPLFPHRAYFGAIVALGLFLFLFLACWDSCYSDVIPQSQPSVRRPRSMKFGGNRNRSHFKLLEDPKLAKYFAPDFVWHLSSFRDRDEFLRMTSTLRKINPNTILGSYASPLYALSAEDDLYPPAHLPLSQCPKNWLLRNKDGTVRVVGEEKHLYCLDVRQKEVRQAVITLAVERAKHNRLDALCFDNCYWGRAPRLDFPVSVDEWTQAYMKFYEEAGKAARQAGLKCVVNVATYPSQIPDAFLAIAAHVDGLMTELAFYPNIRTPERLIRELKGYEQLLKQGKIVLVGVSERKDEQFALLAVWPLARKYGNIYVSVRGLVQDEPLYWLADYEFDIGVE